MAGNLAKIGKVLGQMSTASSKVCVPAVATQNRNCKSINISFTLIFFCQSRGRPLCRELDYTLKDNLVLKVNSDSSSMKS